ncbi:uncharacterized protein LOC143032247 [Oratosquilla oratoria]|uniref:uncharacterized protein LOC143032247 n=1 Tax=Oratosquilla oratoria TaxID=337810 RepID=UPI003F763AE1
MTDNQLQDVSNTTAAAAYRSHHSYSRSHSHLLVAGDLNTHHPMLHLPSPTNETGRHLAVLLEDIPHIRLLNTGEATHTRGRRLDLTLASSDLAAGATWQFYNEEVREHNHRVNIHRKLYKRRPTPTNLRLLQDVVARAREVSLKAREAKWLEWCASFSHHTSLSQLWKSVKTASGAAPPRPAAHPHPHQEAERLVAEFTTRGSSDQLPGSTRRLQQQLRPRRDMAIEEATKEADVTDRPFTPQELEQAKRRGRDTAAGADGVTYSMIAHAGLAGDAALLATVNESWMAGCLPPSWKEADIQPIPKPREPTKLRPISLLSCCTAKTAERMVLARLQWRVGPLHPHIFGYTRGRSTVDSILTLLNQVNHRPAIVVSLDLEKAFELASPHAILAALARKGVMGRMLAWLRDYLQHRRARVKFQGLKSSFQRLEQLVALPFHNGTILLSYADDLALVVTGRGNKLRKAQQTLDIINGKCEDLGLKISAEKFRAMMVRAADPAGQLCVQGVGLAWANLYQYLGVWVDKWLSFTAHAAYLRERAQVISLSPGKKIQQPIAERLHDVEVIDVTILYYDNEHD